MKCISSVFLFLFLGITMLDAQCVKGNCYDGTGVYIYPSGAKYHGQFTQGKINGYGKLIFSNGNEYLGEWKNNYREGKGRLVYVNGDVYSGEFKKSKFSGIGIIVFKKGDRYEGQWSDDLQHGKGIYYYKSGNRYEGDFSKGRINGRGIMFYKNGNRYEGQWSNNFKDGQGKFYHANGKITEGVWANGKYINEKQEQIAENSSASPSSTHVVPNEKDLIDCTYGNCPDGIAVYAYGDGSKWVGSFVDGKPHGNGTCYYANGDKYVGDWEHHSPHGEGIMYYASGKVVGAIWEYGNPIKQLEAKNEMIAKEEVSVDENEQVKIWAVVVGVARYAHMPVLKYTDDDAYHIYAFLKSPEGGALPDEQISVLIDDDANRTNIIRNMRNVFLKADDNDVIIMYFSGHGLPGSFLPVDFDGFNNKLQHHDIKQILKESKAKHKLVLADACHSGSLLAMKSSVKETLKRYYSAFEESSGGTALLLSSKGDEYSLEDNGLRQGIFSHYLIKGLKGEADQNNNSIVTINELFDYVYKNVKIYTGNAQNPTLTGVFDPGMPVAAIR